MLLLLLLLRLKQQLIRMNATCDEQTVDACCCRPCAIVLHTVTNCQHLP